jgi:hypothetical protein
MPEAWPMVVGRPFVHRSGGSQPPITRTASSYTVNSCAAISVANGFDVPLDATAKLMLGCSGTMSSTVNLQLDGNGYWK